MPTNVPCGAGLFATGRRIPAPSGLAIGAVDQADDTRGERLAGRRGCHRSATAHRRVVVQAELHLSLSIHTPTRAGSAHRARLPCAGFRSGSIRRSAIVLAGSPKVSVNARILAFAPSLPRSGRRVLHRVWIARRRSLPPLSRRTRSRWRPAGLEHHRPSGGAVAAAAPTAPFTVKNWPRWSMARPSDNSAHISTYSFARS